MTFFNGEYSQSEIIMLRTITNHMVPLTPMYVKPIFPKIDLNLGFFIRKTMVNNFVIIGRRANISCSNPTKSTLLRRLLF